MTCYLVADRFADLLGALAGERFPAVEGDLAVLGLDFEGAAGAAGALAGNQRAAGAEIRVEDNRVRLGEIAKHLGEESHRLLRRMDALHQFFSARPFSPKATPHVAIQAESAFA